jgi:hypothetical protein
MLSFEKTGMPRTVIHLNQIVPLPSDPVVHRPHIAIALAPGHANVMYASDILIRGITARTNTVYMAIDLLLQKSRHLVYYALYRAAARGRHDKGAGGYDGYSRFIHRTNHLS